MYSKRKGSRRELPVDKKKRVSISGKGVRKGNVGMWT